MSPLLPAAPTSGRRIAGAVKTVPEVPRDRAVVGKRDRREPAPGDAVAKSMTCLPTNTRIVVARTPGGRYASHANDLVHLTLAPRRKRIVGTNTQAPVHVVKANLAAAASLTSSVRSSRVNTRFGAGSTRGRRLG